MRIQLVKDIVQQQQRRCLRCRALQKFKLSQLQGNDIRLVLSLRALTTHGMIAQCKHQVVAMHTMQRVAYGTILHAVTTYHIQKRTALTMRHILQSHLFATLRNLLIILLEYGRQFIDKRLTFLVEQFASLCHLLFPQVHEHGVERLTVGCRLLAVTCLFQQCIALLVGIVITCQGIDIPTVVLRNDDVHQVATFLAAALNQ